MLWKALTIVLALAVSTPALAKNYLTDKAAFDAAWAELADKADLYGDLEGQASHVIIRQDSISLIAPTYANSRDLEVWSIAKEDHLIWGERDKVTNKGAPRKSGRYIWAQKSLFDLREIPIERLFDIANTAAEFVEFKWQPTPMEIAIGREHVGTREVAFRDVQWRILTGTPGDRAKLLTDAQGNYIEADISNTVKGRNRNFLEQTNWPFAEAQAELAKRVGDAEVLRLTARPNSISITVTSPKSKRITPTYGWDGGRYKHNATNMMGQRWHLLGGRKPVKLTDFKLTDLHGMIKAARRYTGQPDARVSDVTVTNDAAKAGGHEVIWTVTLFDPARGGLINTTEHWIVSIRADGSLARIRLPDHEAPGKENLDPATLAANLKLALRSIGQDTEVSQAMFTDRQAAMIHRGPNAGDFVEFFFKNTRIEANPTQPNGDVSELVFFKMGKAKGLTAEDITAMYKAAGEALEAPGGKIYQARLWGGKKGVYHLNGEPIVLLHVALPDGSGPAGIVAFHVDGTVAQVVK